MRLANRSIRIAAKILGSELADRGAACAVTTVLLCLRD